MISIENFDLTSTNTNRIKQPSSPYFMDKPTKSMGLLKIGAGVGASTNEQPFANAGHENHGGGGGRNHSRGSNQAAVNGKANQYKPVILMKAMNRNSSTEDGSKQLNGTVPRQPAVVLAPKPTLFTPSPPAEPVVKNHGSTMVMSRSFIGQPGAPSSSSPSSSSNPLSASPKTAQIQKEVAKPTAQAAQVAANVTLTPEVIGARVSTAPFMTSPVKLLDDNLSWQDGLQEFLLDQPDFLVVGVLGKERTGKSTLMSYLAGCSSDRQQEDLLFSKQTSSSAASYQATSGVQAYVTNERTILLDVQPLLSSSILDKTIGQDKKYVSSDYKFNENYIELQSIELACFVLSVCNVVILTEDWFTDPNLFRLIKTAEMLTPSYTSSQPVDADFNFNEHRPHLVYVLNKCGYMNSNELEEMKEAVRFMARGSKLIHRGSLNASLGAHLRHHIRSRKSSDLDKENINMLLMPHQQATTSSPAEGMLTNFAGMPSFERSVNTFTNQVLGIKRLAKTSCNLFGGPAFTEKRWLAFAAKMWDLIRKSTSINEYNRLMT